MDPNDDYWVCDYRYLRYKCLGIRLVFNEKRIFKDFSQPNSNDLEIELLSEILSQIDNFSPEDEIKKTIELIKQNKGKSPRFSVINKQKMVAFPDYENPEIPQLHDHKLSRKVEAEIALRNGIKPGKYQYDQAKSILNILKKQMISKLEKDISQFDFEKNIGYLISKHDALINTINFKKFHLMDSKIRDVDYSRVNEFSSAKEEYNSHYKDYQYLIEKFVQIKPNGTNPLNARSFRYLLALVNKINEIYWASDNLHYQIYSVGLEIDSDFVLSIQNEVDLDSLQKIFYEEQAIIDLGLRGNPNDQISLEPIEDYLDEIDKAFYLDFEFGFTNMINVLQIMSGWTYYSDQKNERTFYIAPLEQIAEIVQKNIQDFDINETEPIIEFLTMKQAGMLTIIDESMPADDLPVWENYKRPFRYSIKPLIKQNNNIFWGPHSTTRSGMTWLGSILNGTLPVRLDAPNIIKIQNRHHEILDEKLEEKAREIARRFTTYVENVNYGRGTHPQKVGEYDALVYLEEQKILLNIECKNINNAYCLKDIRRIREKIFGKNYKKRKKGQHQGNLIKVEKRESWLRNNNKKFADILNWPVKKNPRIISIYLTRKDYWWTKFPPRDTDVVFMRIDFFDEYISKLID